MNDNTTLSQLSLFDIEVWKPVVGFEGLYAVSNHGRVMRTKPAPHTHVGKILTPYKKRAGYFVVTLYLGKEQKYPTVHGLVMKAFVGFSNGLDINHKDGDKSNNCLSNLEYVTRLENNLHAIRTGLHIPAKGEQVHGVKLTRSKVGEIRTLYATGRYSQEELGARFGVTRSTVGQIVRGKIWK
jgi:hypothetical protein